MSNNLKFLWGNEKEMSSEISYTNVMESSISIQRGRDADSEENTKFL